MLTRRTRQCPLLGAFRKSTRRFATSGDQLIADTREPWQARAFMSSRPRLQLLQSMHTHWVDCMPIARATPRDKSKVTPRMIRAAVIDHHSDRTSVLTVRGTVTRDPKGSVRGSRYADWDRKTGPSPSAAAMNRRSRRSAWPDQVPLRFRVCKKPVEAATVSLRGRREQPSQNRSVAQLMDAFICHHLTQSHPLKGMALSNCSSPIRRSTLGDQPAGGALDFAGGSPLARGPG